MKTSKAPALFVFHNEHNLAPLGAARYRAGVKDGDEVGFIRLVSSARREASPEFKPLLAISLSARQGHYKCQMLYPAPSISCPLSLSLFLCLASFDIDVELMRWVRRAILLHATYNLQMCATHTYTHLHTCSTALICIDSRTLETLISWATAHSQCDGCTNLCLHSHNILFIKINDFDLTYNPSHAHALAHHTYACLAKVEASPNENWILVTNMRKCIRCTTAYSPASSLINQVAGQRDQSE